MQSNKADSFSSWFVLHAGKYDNLVFSHFHFNLILTSSENVYMLFMYKD